jgi:hypothetical protein
MKLLLCYSPSSAAVARPAIKVEVGTINKGDPVVGSEEEGDEDADSQRRQGEEGEQENEDAASLFAAFERNLQRREIQAEHFGHPQQPFVTLHNLRMYRSRLKNKGYDGLTPRHSSKHDGLRND